MYFRHWPVLDISVESRFQATCFAGGVLSYLVLIPAIVYFGGESLSVVMDSAGNAIAFNALSPGAIWSNYIRYIGAGAVAAGGILSLVKSLPVMIKTFVKVK